MLDKERKIRKLNAINETISNQLITSDQSFNILFEKTKNFFNQDIMVVYHAAYEILIKTIQASEAYILHLEGNRFTLASPSNQNKNLSYFDIYKREIEEVRQSHQFLRLDKLDMNLVSSDTPVFVGPIIHQATDTLFGIIIVQELDLLHYNKNTYRTFVNLCKWLGEILYFRTQHNLTITPVMSRMDFDYIVDFGSSRLNIKKIVDECFL